MKQALILLPLLLAGCHQKKPKPLDLTRIVLPPPAGMSDILSQVCMDFDKPPEVRPPAGHPPLRIVVGANLWTVHYTTELALHARDAEAFENSASHKIWLPIEPHEEDPAELLLHELLHAALAESRMGEVVKYGPKENSFVEPMSPVLLQVMRDNPQLVKWMIRRGR